MEDRHASLQVTDCSVEAPLRQEDQRLHVVVRHDVREYRADGGSIIGRVAPDLETTQVYGVHILVFADELCAQLVAARAVATRVDGRGPTCLLAEEGEMFWQNRPVDRLVERLDRRTAGKNAAAADRGAGELLVSSLLAAIIIIDETCRSLQAADKGAAVVAFAKFLAVIIASSVALRLLWLAAADGRAVSRLEEAVGTGDALRVDDPADFLAFLAMRQLDHPIGSLHVALQHTDEGATKGLGHSRASTVLVATVASACRVLVCLDAVGHTLESLVCLTATHGLGKAPFHLLERTVSQGVTHVAAMSAPGPVGLDGLDDQVELLDVHWRTWTMLAPLYIDDIFFTARNGGDQVALQTIAADAIKAGVTKRLPSPTVALALHPLLHLGRQARRAVPPVLDLGQQVEVQLICKRHAFDRLSMLQLRVHQC